MDTTRILILFDTAYGSTALVAESISKVLTEKGFQVDLLRAGSVDPSPYEAVLIGGPIRLGRCTSRIRRYLKKNRSVLVRMRVAFFFTCMSVTNNEHKTEVPVYVDPAFETPDRPRARIGAMENNHTVSYYLNHILGIVPEVTPLGISFFKGRLNTAKLKPLHRLVMAFAMFSLPEIQNGDFVNLAAVRAWTEELSRSLAQARQ